VLLVCEADGVSWKLWTYKESYLSISPVKWSAEDLSTVSPKSITAVVLN
jgi:hypothetical protein